MVTVTVKKGKVSFLNFMPWETKTNTKVEKLLHSIKKNKKKLILDGIAPLLTIHPMVTPLMILIHP